MVASIYHATERFRRRCVLVLIIVPMLTLLAPQAAVPAGPLTPRAPCPARGPFLALAQPVRALAAGTTAIAALADSGEVVIFDLEGRVRRRMAPAPAGATHGRHRRAPAVSGRDGFAIGAGVLEDDDFNDAYDVDSEVEDPENLFLDESEGGRRWPRRGGAPVMGPTLVAAGGRSIWTAGPGGLSRFDIDDEGEVVGPRHEGRRTRGAGGEVWGALSASTDGRWVVGAHDGWVVRSGDGGETFTTLGPAGDLPRRLAISDDGTVFVIERRASNGASFADGPGVRAISPDTAIDVSTCGRRAMVLEAERTLVMGPDVPGALGIDPGGAASVVGERPPDETVGIACAAAGHGLVAYGTRLWTLASDGHAWSRREEVPALPIRSAVVAGDTVWAATGGGLWALPLDPPTGPVISDRAEGAALKLSTLPPSMAGAGFSAPESRAAWWAAVLPRIDIGFTDARAAGRREVRAFVLLTFMLDGERGWARERRRLTFEDAGWRRTALGMLVSLAHPPAPGCDPIDQEERAALAHVLESTP